MDKTDYIEIPTDLLQVINAEQANHYGIVPKEVDGNRYCFYCDETAKTEDLKEELEILLGKEVAIVQENSNKVRKTITKYYRKNLVGSGNKVKKINASDDFIEKIIFEANELGSSDIHIEAYENKGRIRMRIDGKLAERYDLKKQEYPAIVNKIKIKANLDIAEKRLPQDGRIFFKTVENKFDIRVSVLPTLHGEKVVLRLLSKDATEIELSRLGMNELQLAQYKDAIKNPHGIILISGPTGSGKTTTLYATLKILNELSSNILTIEDPIEYTLEGINQVQLKENIGLNFARALKTFLRQDPDIIMLGEIRDGETAQMAVRAAMTGHLVLSTIHTNSAWGTISRLLDMRVPGYLLSGTIVLSVAQRLVRVLCNKCKIEKEFNLNDLPTNYKLPYQITKAYESNGCEECYYTGYKGRKALYEMIPIDKEIAEQIKAQNTAYDVLKEKGIKSLDDCAFDLYANGDTSIEEIYPILNNSTRK